MENKIILKAEFDKQQDSLDFIENQGERESRSKQLYRQESNEFKIKRGMKIKLNCEFCKDPILANLHVYRFANYERFFCCAGCMSGYKKKYAGRIESVKRRFMEEKNSF